MTIDEIFTRFIEGTDQDKAEVREFIRRHENLHMLHSPAFLNTALRYADFFGFKQLTLEEFEAQLDATPTTLP